MGLIMLAPSRSACVSPRTRQQLVGAPAGYDQKTLIAQIAEAVFHDFPLGFYFISVVTALILVLAANTAFNGFPVLGSILAQDRYLPRQLHTRGDRLAFSNGIVFLAGVALVLVIAFDAEVTALIQLYIVGVFVSFTLSQLGMIRHWNRLLRTETDPQMRARMRRSQAINAIGLVHDRDGAGHRADHEVRWRGRGSPSWRWPPSSSHDVDPQALRRGALASSRATDDDGVLPSRMHAIVLVSKLHLPTLRALPTPGPPGPTRWRR